MYGIRLRAWLPIVALAVAPAPARAGADATPARVLAVHWSAEDFPTTPVTDAAIREALQSPTGRPVDYYAEYLESDRFPEEQASLALGDYIQRKYQGQRIDLVIAITDVALDFVQQHRARLFPDAPIVYTGVTPPDRATRRAGAGIVTVTSGSGFGETLELALTLHPETRRVYVIAEAPDAKLKETMRNAVRGFERQVELLPLTARAVPELIAAVKMVPDDSLILYIRYSQEEPGHVLYPSDVARLVAQAARVPVYGVWDSYIGVGVVGGVVYSSPAVGTRVGTIARQILDGARPQMMAVAQVPHVPTFDWRQLQRWRIDPSRLPPGAIIRFRPATAWDLYRWYIVSAFVLFAAQALTIASLVVQRARRRETEARTAAILRAMPDTMFLQTKDGLYVDFHAPDHTALLVQPEQFIGRHMREVLPPALTAIFDEQFARLGSGAAPLVVEYTLDMPDGRHHYEARIAPCRDKEVLSVVRDITARKRAEEALAEHEERYALAAAAGGVGVWDWNLDTNDLYVDPGLKAILGFRNDEIRNHMDDWSQHVHPDDRAAVIERAHAYIEGKSQLYEVEHRMIHRDGSIRWFLARGSAVRRDDVAVRLVGTHTDITARKKSEQALHDAQDEITRVSRLTALGEFAASIAHEVSQPLTAIMVNARTCLRWLADTSPDLTEVRAVVWDVVEASKRANDVIRRNSELFRHHTVQKAPIDVNGVVREVEVLAASHLQRSGVTLATALEAGLPTIVADRVELQQVLLNLILNAIDAMDGIAPAARRIEIESTLTNGDGVQVSVRDHGAGLQGVDTDRMFMPSYTTKAHGTGVGLSISRSIIHAHGGRLWAEPNEDCGATFRFTVPIQAPATRDASPEGAHVP